MKKIMIYAIIALGVVISVLTMRVQSLTKEKDRLSSNQETLFSDIDYYQTEDSLNVASIGKLTLTKKEFEKHNSELSYLVKRLNLKVKNLQSITSTATEAKHTIKTILKDSLVLRDSTIIDTIKCFKYDSPFLDFESCTEDGINFTTNIVSRDSLYTIAHRIRKKWWFIRWGTKGFRQEVVNANKNSKITYSTYIEFE